MEPMRSSPPETERVDLDPALLADPRLVLARSRPARPARPPGRRLFAHGGPVDPARFGRADEYEPASYKLVRPSPAKRAAAVALIVVAGTGLGVAIAGFPH